MITLENRVAVVTGAASGIGAATARVFAEDIAYLYLYLASEQAGYVSGQLIVADGARSFAGLS